MATNPFKAFIAYEIKRVKDFDAITDAIGAPEPTGGQWRTAYFTEMPTGEHFSDLENCKIGCLQFNERMLPGRVIKEEVDKRVAKLAEQSGHKIGKKARAEIRDQVEFDLLPKAFIKRTPIYFAFLSLNRKPVLLVFTSSQKRADDVVGHLEDTFAGALQPRKIEMDGRLGGWLTTLAYDGQDGFFWSDQSATLVGDDGKKVTVKDMAVEAKVVSDLLKDGFSVTSLSMRIGKLEDGGDVLFTLTDKAIFKGFTIDGVKPSQAKEDFAGFAVMYVGEIRAMLIELMNEIEEQEGEEL